MKASNYLPTPERSALMARVRQKNTAPEIVVRKLLHRLGYRFRLHRRNLPGTPDIVLPKYRKILFVHGCFWHRHLGCGKTTTPKTRTEFWEEKFRANVARDQANEQALRAAGWEPLVIWECETSDIVKLEQWLRRLLSASPRSDIGSNFWEPG